MFSVPKIRLVESFRLPFFPSFYDHPFGSETGGQNLPQQGAFDLIMSSRVVVLISSSLSLLLLIAIISFFVFLVETRQLASVIKLKIIIWVKNP